LTGLLPTPSPQQLGPKEDTADRECRWDTQAKKRSWGTAHVVFVAEAAFMAAMMRVVSAVSKCRHRPEQNPE
jgi:hypothetical protein